MDQLNNDILKTSFKQTKLEASESLKYRIMQQIQTESALRKEKPKQRINFSYKVLISVMASMYTVIGLAAFYIFKLADNIAEADKTYSITVIAITVVIITFTLFSIHSFDELRLSKKTEN